jgi:hypothetical protein
MESDANDPTAAWMHQLANDPMERSHRPLPDPDLLWMKAQLLNRQAAAERGLRVVRWFETVARVLVGFSACWLAIGLSKVVAVPAIWGLSPTMLSLAASLVLVAVAMLAFPIWSQD